MLTASADTACVTAGTLGVVDGATGVVVGAKGSSASCESWTVAGSSTLVPDQHRFRCASASTLAASVVISEPVSVCRDECTKEAGGAVGASAASSGEATAVSLTPTAKEKGETDMVSWLQAVTQQTWTRPFRLVVKMDDLRSPWVRTTSESRPLGLSTNF